MDANGVYISAVLAGTLNTTKIASIPASIFSAQNSTVISASYIHTFSGGGNSFPAVTIDGTANESQWFVQSGVNTVWYKQLTWNNGVPTLDSTWTIISDPTPQGTLNSTVNAEQLGSSASRVNSALPMLSTPIMRKVNGVRYLWTSRTVAVNASGGASAPDRTGIEWIRITTGPTVSISSNAIWDPGTTPRYYYFSSIAANKRGDLFLGFSGSSASEYIGAYYIGYLNGGTWPTSPTKYYAGKDWYNGTSPFRWGDYSATVVDPDGFRFWSIQEYAEIKYNMTENAYGTRIVSAAP